MVGVDDSAVSDDLYQRHNWDQLGRFLATFPSPSTVLKHLTIDVLQEWEPRAAWIVFPDDTGTFRLDASFGAFDTRGFESDPPSVFGSHPLAATLTSEEGIVAKAPGRPYAGITLMGEDISHVAAFSTYLTARMRFIIGIGCAGSQDNAQACLREVMAVAPLLSVYLNYMHDRREIAADGSPGRGPSGPAASMTPRQSTILRLLSDNMKNREIAFTIGYSESTVRIETIAIYQKLGVNGRHEAVRLAARLGLLEESPGEAGIPGPG